MNQIEKTIINLIEMIVLIDTMITIKINKIINLIKEEAILAKNSQLRRVISRICIFFVDILFKWKKYI